MSDLDIPLFAQAIGADILRIMENASAEQKLKSEAIAAYHGLLTVALAPGAVFGLSNGDGCHTNVQQPRGTERPPARHHTPAEQASQRDFSERMSGLKEQRVSDPDAE